MEKKNGFSWKIIKEDKKRKKERKNGGQLKNKIKYLDTNPYIYIYNSLWEILMDSSWLKIYRLD